MLGSELQLKEVGMDPIITLCRQEQRLPFLCLTAVKGSSERHFPLIEQLATMKLPLSKALNPAGLNVLSEWETSRDNDSLHIQEMGSSLQPKLADCGCLGQLSGMNVH